MAAEHVHHWPGKPVAGRKNQGKCRKVNSLLFLTNLGADGIGNDLTSCNFPLSVLAVNGIRLSASLLNNSIAVLSWNSLEPTNSNGYDVERSTDGLSWQVIHFSASKNNDHAAMYTFSDDNPSAGTQYYRIRETDKSGTVTYSAVQKVTIGRHNGISIWPNPAQVNLQVQATELKAGTSQAFIYDLSGRTLSWSTIKSGSGTIAVNELQPGTYVVQVKFADGTVMNKKFVKQ